MDTTIGGSRGGVRDARPPLGVQILSISCSFRENLACSRPPWRVHAPPSGKSATDNIIALPCKLCGRKIKTQHDLFVGHSVSIKSVIIKNYIFIFLGVKIRMQKRWRVRDFPDGRVNPKRGCANLNGPRGEGRP